MNNTRIVDFVYFIHDLKIMIFKTSSIIFYRDVGTLYSLKNVKQNQFTVDYTYIRIEFPTFLFYVIYIS